MKFPSIEPITQNVIGSMHNSLITAIRRCVTSHCWGNRARACGLYRVTLARAVIDSYRVGSRPRGTEHYIAAYCSVDRHRKPRTNVAGSRIRQAHKRRTSSTTRRGTYGPGVSLSMPRKRTQLEQQVPIERYTFGAMRLGALEIDLMELVPHEEGLGARCVLYDAYPCSLLLTASP